MRERSRDVKIKNIKKQNLLYGCFKKQFTQKISDQKMKLKERDKSILEREREWEGEISIGKNKEYKKEKIFYIDVLKTIHKKISNQKMKSKERDKSILEYVQCMYNNVHIYKVPGFWLELLC